MKVDGEEPLTDDELRELRQVFAFLSEYLVDAGQTMMVFLELARDLDDVPPAALEAACRRFEPGDAIYELVRSRAVSLIQVHDVAKQIGETTAPTEDTCWARPAGSAGSWRRG